MKRRAKKLKEEVVKERITVSICKSDLFFDVIAEGEESDLWRLKKELNLETRVLKMGAYGKPLIVIDTYDDFTSAKEAFRDAIWDINQEIKKWK